jgi:hypothetical protein
MSLSCVKPPSTGPFYVEELEVKKPLNANLGFAGQQSNTGTVLRGGATQVEFLIPSTDAKMDYLKPISIPKKLKGN